MKDGAEVTIVKRRPGLMEFTAKSESCKRFVKDKAHRDYFLLGCCNMYRLCSVKVLALRVRVAHAEHSASQGASLPQWLGLKKHDLGLLGCGG